jgi:uncharacterized protein YndB with AHSA1/START domain
MSSDVASASVDVAVNQEAAFRIFTEDVGKWYLIAEHTVVDHTRTKTLRFDPWVGGRFRAIYDLETGEGAGGALITAWEPPHRLVFVDSRDMEVEVGFTPVDGGCRVTVVQRGFDKLDPDEARRVREHGWFVHLPVWFGEYVSGQPSAV